MVCEEMDALIGIGEGVDRVDGASKLIDSILAIGAVVVDVTVQPNEKDILGHLNRNSTTLQGHFLGRQRIVLLWSHQGNG